MTKLNWTLAINKYHRSQSWCTGAQLSILSVPCSGSVAAGAGWEWSLVVDKNSGHFRTIVQCPLLIIFSILLLTTVIGRTFTSAFKLQSKHFFFGVILVLNRDPRRYLFRYFVIGFIKIGFYLFNSCFSHKSSLFSTEGYIIVICDLFLEW